MASILRSSKFVRYIAGFARNVVANAPREVDSSLVNTSQCLCGAIPRSLATQTSTQYDQNLEKSLRRIDQDVRKSGRISRRDIEDVLEEIRNTRSATSSQSLLVIRCCGNLVPEELPEIRTKLVQEIWNTLNKLNVPMDVSHYNALLRVYLENEHSFSPTEFLSELESKGIEPNRVTYQRLIARYCQVGDIEGATKVLEYMREKQLPVNENVFNALIVGHSQAGDMDSAHGILAVMLQAGLEPSADTYTTLLCGYAKKGDIETITNIIAECEEKEVFLLDKDYLDMIYSLATNGHNQHVPFILSKVRKSIGYNQDAINLILRLINKGQDLSAFEVLQSMARSSKADGSQAPSGHFFIKQLVKANRPVEKILELCTKLEQNEMYDRAVQLAAETSLQLGNDTLAYPLLEELQKRGTEIRQHYFWPLLVSKQNNGRDMVKVLTQMVDFNIQPSGETLREYVIPHLKGKSSDILRMLRDANISVGSSACSLVVALLQKNELNEAALIAGSVLAYYSPDLIRRPLTNAFYKTQDLDSYVQLLRVVQENSSRKSLVRNTEGTEQPVDVVSLFVGDLLSNSRGFVEVAEPVLVALVGQGLSISTTTAERIQEKLGEKMTDNVSQLLGKLTSGELSPVPIVKAQPSYIPSHQMNIAQLERLVHNLEAKGQEVKGLNRQLLTLYYREKELEKTEALLERLKDTEFVFTAGIYAQLSDLYCSHDNLEKALENFEKVKAMEQESFTMDENKTVRLAQLLVKNGQFEEAIKMLEETPRDRKQEERRYTYHGLIWRFLNSLAEAGRVEDLNRLFDTLVKKGYIEANNVVLGPLIKVHLINNNIDNALEKFEWCVNQFKATPWKNELACKLIQSEDAEKLQKLTDLSTSVHGEINSLYDLVFAFVECGRVRQARKILETPGLQNRPQRINSACERYQQEGLVKPLEGLKDATKDLNHIDRSDIYYQLLLSYIKQDDGEKALGLWTQMQEEGLAPNDQFLHQLGTFLSERGFEVPFAIPQDSSLNVVEPKVVVPPVKSQLQIFREKMRNNDLDGALAFKNRSSEKFNTTDLSALIEKLVQKERIAEATQLSIEIIDRGNMPVNRVFRFLLNKLAAAGDIESLNAIGDRIDKEVKKVISFDNRICHANLVAGKAEEYLNQLEQDIDSATDENLGVISERFPRGGAYGILERHPELTQKYETMAIKYAKRGIVAPLNVLWTNYFITNNDVVAEQLWQEYLKDSPRIMFQRIVQTARDKQDEVLTRKLIEHLKISNVTEGAIGNAYSCLLDVLVLKNKDEEAVEAFEKAAKEVRVESINRTAVLRVKAIYEKLDKPFNHVIPPKVNKTQTSTSSSSESDELKKQPPK